MWVGVPHSPQLILNTMEQRIKELLNNIVCHKISIGDGIEEIKKLFEALGIVIELPVHLMGIGGALTGCGPAFVDLIIEALGDAGVKYGVPRKQAYEMVSQMILGSAKLQLETGEHPGVLKDNVCSPAGTTICGVDALEHAGIRAGFIDAIDAIMNK
jgi:pyrroline-5-carboxylate reductase